MDETNGSKGRKILCGAAVGLANGLFGGGGGMLAVPMLRSGGMEEKKSHATAILLILPICVFSFFLYFIRGLYSVETLLPTAFGVTAGGALGAYLLDKLPVNAVRLLFILLQLLAGIFLVFF